MAKIFGRKVKGKFLRGRKKKQPVAKFTQNFNFFTFFSPAPLLKAMQVDCIGYDALTPEERDAFAHQGLVHVANTRPIVWIIPYINNGRWRKKTQRLTCALFIEPHLTH